jgi:hypothetical protein
MAWTGHLRGKIIRGCLNWVQGAAGAAKLERRQQDLLWEVYEQLDPHAELSERSTYRSMLANLELEVSPVRRCVVQLSTP